MCGYLKFPNCGLRTNYKLSHVWLNIPLILWGVRNWVCAHKKYRKYPHSLKISHLSKLLGHNWFEQSLFAALGPCRENVVATIFCLFLSSAQVIFLAGGVLLRFWNFACGLNWDLKKISKQKVHRNEWNEDKIDQGRRVKCAQTGVQGPPSSPAEIFK